MSDQKKTQLHTFITGYRVTNVYVQKLDKDGEAILVKDQDMSTVQDDRATVVPVANEYSKSNGYLKTRSWEKLYDMEEIENGGGRIFKQVYVIDWMIGPAKEGKKVELINKK